MITPAPEARVHLLNYRDGAPQPAPAPGLLARAAPRRAARGRERDTLFLGLALNTHEPAGDSLAGELAALAAEAYFGTPGSVTAALREAAAVVNTSLLQSNLRGVSSGAHIQGNLACAVLHNLDLYVAVCGAPLGLVAHAGAVEHFPTGDSRSRPLGISQTVGVQYFHTRVSPGDAIVLSPAPPIPWEGARFDHLAGAADAGRLEAGLRDCGAADFAALLVHFPLPDAEAEPVPRPAAPAPAPAPAPRPVPSPTGAPAPVPAPRPAPPPTGAPAPVPRPVPSPTGVPAPAPAPRPVPSPTGAPAPAPVPRPIPSPTGAPAPESAAGQDSAPPRRLPSPGLNIGRSLRAIWRATGVALAEALRGLRLLVARTLPEGTLQREGLFYVPASFWAAVAVAFPVVVVAVMSVVYNQRGRAEAYQHYLQAAQAELAIARTQPAPLVARPNYEAALRALEQAREFADTQQVQSLFLEARGALDQLDGVTRLNFRPLLPGGFGPQAQIAALLMGERDLYALDAASNQVRLARANAIGFDYDPTFGCAPQQIAGLGVGTLVDIAWFPAPTVFGARAALLAFDRNGSALFCAPDTSPRATRPIEPEGGWQNPLAVEVYSGRLYVLDSGANEIWLYDSTDGAFARPPTRYFGSLPHDVGDVVDFSIAQGDVFLLHADGRLTACNRTGAPETTSCSDLNFVDGREGRRDGPVIDGAAPFRMLFLPPPEPSLYFVDTVANGVYQYSLRLIFQRQYRPLNPLAGQISALAIGAKEMYVAVKNNVFYSSR